MRMLRRWAWIAGCALWVWGAGEADAVTGLDGRWYPTYRPQIIRWAQEALKATNAYAGPVNGVLDAATMQALKDFQHRAGLRPSGVPTPLTRRALQAVAPGVRLPAGPQFQGAGTVVGRVGEVRVTRAAPPSRRAPKGREHRINPNDVVETGADGKAMVVLDDGSTLILGNNTRIQVRDLVSAPTEGETSVLVEATRGVLRIVARALADAGTDIRVQAPTAFAAVRATDWMMWIAPDATAVFVEEGSVAVMNIGPSAKQVVVAKGQGTDVGAGKQPTDPAPWAYQRVMDLRKSTDYP
jgi:ferric-dicitrate binding protein FerR (iron transport regulator)